MRLFQAPLDGCNGIFPEPRTDHALTGGRIHLESAADRAGTAQRFLDEHHPGHSHDECQGSCDCDF